MKRRINKKAGEEGMGSDGSNTECQRDVKGEDST
jgi:hypothetical protein